jgi:hypothetical protein
MFLQRSENSTRIGFSPFFIETSAAADTDLARRMRWFRN